MNHLSGFQIWRLSGFTVAINALFCSLIVLFTIPSESWLINFSSSLFLPSALFAHFSFLFSFVALILFVAYLLHLRNKAWLSSACVLFGLLILLIVVDTRVYSLYRFHLNNMTLNLLMGGAAADILSFSWQTWLSVISIISGIFMLEIAFIVCLFKQNKISGKGAWAFILVLMVSTQVTYAYHQATGQNQIVSQVRHIPWSRPITMNSLFKKLGIIDQSSNSKSASLEFNNNLGINYPIKPLICNNKKQYNYLILMVDSVRSDMFTAEIMPNTHHFSQSAVTFNDHWSTSNSTRFGLFGFFYGLPPTYWFDMLNEQKGSVLFDVLKANNYQLHLDAAAPLNSPEFDKTIFSSVRTELQWGKQNSTKETDTAVIDRLISFLDKDRQNNFFAFSFLDAPHAYKLPDDETPVFQPALDQVNYLSLNNDYDPEQFLNLYKSSIHYNDRLLGQVYKKLTDKNLLNNTVVIITSDHGQEFNDLKKNYWGHNGNFSEYQVKVPLVIHWPNQTTKQISTITSHEDVIPTLLKEGLSCENATSDYSTGYSLFNDKLNHENRNLLLSNWNMKAIFTGQHYYNFPVIGNMEVLDRQYNQIYDHKVDFKVIQDKLFSMKQFIK